MYHSPVPLIVIRSSAHSLIEVNGQILGECLPGAHVAMPAGDTGDYYISATPLSPGPWRAPLLRKLSLENGVICPPEAGDVSVCAWPGGVYEFALDPKDRGHSRAVTFPHDIDQLSFSIGKQRRTLTLYHENGLKLLIEDGGRPRSCISLGQGDYGSLALYTAAGRQFAAVRTNGASDNLLMLDSELNSALELAAEHIFLDEDCVSAVNGLGTLMGHEARVRYTYSAGAFSPQPPEHGFFTHGYAFPQSNGRLAIAFCEAVREGFEAEAMSYLADSLKQEFSFAEIKDFLGNFQCCRPPLSDNSGALLGLIACESERLNSARLYEFSFDGGLISDISEV